MWFLGQAEGIDLGTLLHAASGKHTASENIAVSQLTEDNMGSPLSVVVVIIVDVC